MTDMAPEATVTATYCQKWTYKAGC